MDWDNERYVRLYVRDTADILAIGWEGRALFSEILRKVDRAGLFDSQEPEVIAELIRMPVEVVAKSLPKLIKRGMVECIGDMLLIPNFLEAQEAKASEAQRSREHRARHRDKTRAEQLQKEGGATKRDEQVVQSETKRDGSATKRYEHSTPRDENVTPYCTVPSVPSVPNKTIAHPEAARVSTPRSEVTAAELEAVYQLYPRKKGKAPGLKKAAKLIRTREEFAKFQECVQFMAKAWASADLEFCPYFSTFINEQRWQDEEWPQPTLTGGRRLTPEDEGLKVFG